MQTQNRFLDDFARVTSGAIGVAAGLRGEVEARLREQLERLLGQMDLVTREEFEVVKAMAAKAREEQEVLLDRVAKLEAMLAQKSSPKAAGAARPRSVRKAASSKKAAGSSTTEAKS